MNEDMEFQSELLHKWLRVMMYIVAGSIVNSLVSLLPFVPAVLTTWISKMIMVIMVVCLFRLAPVNERYRKAGILRTVSLVCMIVSPVSLIASILSIIAVYQEYSAHSEVIADKDAQLSRAWHSLFNWSIIISLLVSFGSVVTTLIASFAGMEITRTTAIVVTILSIPEIVIEVVYLRYLEKTRTIGGIPQNEA